MASKDAELNKHGAAGKRKHLTLTVPQELDIIRRFESGESPSVIIAAYTMDCQLFMMQRNRTICPLAWYQTKVRRAFRKDKH
jgi:hypothetical protein